MNYSCYLYIMECGGFIKVGISKDPSGRLRSINTSTPFEVKIIKTFGFNFLQEAKFAEKLAHESLSDMGFHEKLEWFSCGIDQALSVCRESADISIKTIKGKAIGKKHKALSMLELLNLAKVSEITNIEISRLKAILESRNIESKEATIILKLKERL